MKPDYNCYKFKSQRERISTIVKLVGKNNTVLEIGIGDSTITNLLKKNNNTVTTSDAVFNADVKHDFNEYPYPFKSNSFDVIVLTEVLEHLSNASKTLKELYRILKMDGRLVLTVPNIASLKNLIAILFLGKLSYTAEPDKPYGHVCDYWFARLKVLVEKSGFKILDYRTTSCYMKFLKISIPKWMYPRRFGEFIIVNLVKKD